MNIKETWNKAFKEYEMIRRMKRNISFLSMVALAGFLFCQASFASSDKEEKRSCVFEKDGAACHRLGMSKKENDAIIAKRWFKLGCKNDNKDSCDELKSIDALINKQIQKQIAAEKLAHSNRLDEFNGADTNIYNTIDDEVKGLNDEEQSEPEKLKELVALTKNDINSNKANPQVSQEVIDLIRSFSDEENEAARKFFGLLLADSNNIDEGKDSIEQLDAKQKELADHKKINDFLKKDEERKAEGMRKMYEGYKNNPTASQRSIENMKKKLTSYEKEIADNQKKREEGYLSHQKQINELMDNAGKNIQKTKGFIRYNETILKELNNNR